MNKNKVLIVDDEPSIREFLAQILSIEYQVLFAKNGSEAIEIARSQSPNAILLDIIMPGKNGIDVCKQLRDESGTKAIPIIMLTAVNDPDQRTEAFLSGADDYISNPFVPDELLARVESKLRRMSELKPVVTNTLKFGDLTLNFKALKADINGSELELGQIEFKILNCLINSEGQLVHRDVLHDYVWGDEPPSDRALDPHITTLRRKLKSSRSELKTVYGRGYSLILKELAN